MSNHLFTKKTGKIILKSRMLRTLGILCVIFIVLSVTAISFYFSYQQKNTENLFKITQAQQALANLEHAAAPTTGEEGLFQKKSFVGYEEVIPFIAMLESLFSMIDPKSEITIKSREEEIFIDHFADYNIVLKVHNKKELFFKALDELHKSRFVTKLMSFSMNYKPIEDGTRNELSEIELTLRLFLN